jgi:hypothetical protein
MTTPDKNVQPRRLVMLSMENNCMFCEDPRGGAYIYTVYKDGHVGFITCDNCREKCKATFDYWNAHIAYGKARYLKDRVIKIKRSSGEIEDGWALDNPLVDYASDGKKIIHCFHNDKDIARWCHMDEILELNPPDAESEAGTSEADTSEDTINRCLNCGINMGLENPRQLCGKTHCPNEEGEFL